MGTDSTPPVQTPDPRDIIIIEPTDEVKAVPSDVTDTGIEDNYWLLAGFILLLVAGSATIRRLAYTVSLIRRQS